MQTAHAYAHRHEPGTKPLRKTIVQPHGHRRGRGTATYTTWRCMKQRCTNRRHTSYADYGGRGITVDPRWSGPDGFHQFLADMGERPSRRHTLGRRDSNGPYTKANCEWQTVRQQNQGLHYRGAAKRTINGVTKTLHQWAESLRITYRTLCRRVQLGWGDRAFTQAAPRHHRWNGRRAR